jgi:predicted pyridoxine 5'-phosphate oxidase superfamily flavin-nucleotide-binding protein
MTQFRADQPAQPMPGSRGEHDLQDRYGTVARARSFYRRQVLDRLNAGMREFIARQEMCFVATADAGGECDCSFRAGPPGFVQVLDERTLVYAEYRGNGVMASLGNLAENAHVGMLFVDFTRDVIGLHVNGRARVVETPELLSLHPEAAAGAPADAGGARFKARAERWVRVRVEEAYIHCAKHIPRMLKVPREIAWGSDDVRRKGGDFFAASCESRPWAEEPPAAPREEQAPLRGQAPAPS